MAKFKVLKAQTLSWTSLELLRVINLERFYTGFITVNISIAPQRELNMEIATASIISIAEPRENVNPNGTCVYQRIERNHMAQSATPKTPFGVSVFWKSGANASSMVRKPKDGYHGRDNLVVDKLLKLKPNRAELFYQPCRPMKTQSRAKPLPRNAKGSNGMREESWIGRMSVFK